MALEKGDLQCTETIFKALKLEKTAWTGNANFVKALVVLGSSCKPQAVSLLEVLMVFICSTRVSLKPTSLK